MLGLVRTATVAIRHGRCPHRPLLHYIKSLKSFVDSFQTASCHKIYIKCKKDKGK